MTPGGTTPTPPDRHSHTRMARRCEMSHKNKHDHHCWPAKNTHPTLMLPCLLTAGCLLGLCYLSSKVENNVTGMGKQHMEVVHLPSSEAAIHQPQTLQIGAMHVMIMVVRSLGKCIAMLGAHQNIHLQASVLQGPRHQRTVVQTLLPRAAQWRMPWRRLLQRRLPGVSHDVRACGRVSSGAQAQQAGPEHGYPARPSGDCRQADLQGLSR